MNGVSVETLNDKWIIKVDKSITDIDTIDSFIKRLQFEKLSKKAVFDGKKIMELADDIKKDWWEKNKDEFLKGLEIENNN
jgi:hypothetical protein